MLERHHLEIIREVHQQGSLTAAAKQLCLTQSALSHSIKKLEHLLGSPLWQKQGRKLQFSESGKKVLLLANRLLPQFEHTELEIKNIVLGQQGSLRIGMECYPCFQWLIKVVAPFLKQFPDVDIDILKEFQFGGIGALLAYDIDVLITPDPLVNKGLNYIPVFEYEQMLVIANDHHLANKKHIAPKDLINETLLTYPIETSRLDIFSSFLTPANINVKKHKIIENTEILMQMVNANRGVTALPYWLIKEFAPSTSVKTVKLGKKGIHKCLYFGLRMEEKPPQYLTELINLAKQTY